MRWWAAALLLAGVLGATGGLASAQGSKLVTLRVAIAGSGKIVSSPRGIFCPPACKKLTPLGAVYRLSARPEKGWRLRAWSGACTGKRGCLVRMRGAKTVRAAFVRKQKPGPPAPPPPVSGAGLWVDTNGGSCTRQPTAGGYVDAQACGSFQAAYSAAQCGDTVGVRPGTYGQQRISGGSKACTPTTQVHFTAVPGGACTDNTSVSMPSFSISVAYVNLACMNANPPGTTSCADVSGSSGGHSSIIWNSFDHMAIHCAFFDSDHMRVTNSTFGPDNTCETRQEDLIVFRANRGSIDDVVFDHVIFATVTAPPDFQCGSGKHVDSMQGYGMSNLVIANSTFYGCPGQCVIFRPYGGGVPGPLTFQNNVFYEPQDPGGALSLGTGSPGDACNGLVLVQNNTFAAGANMNGGYTTGTNCSMVVRNNIFTGQFGCNLTGNLDSYTNNVFTGSPCGSNGKRCRPSFVGSTNSLTTPGNFHLAATDTCARGAASQTPGTFPANDMDGQPRPQGPVDAGADEIR